MKYKVKIVYDRCKREGQVVIQTNLTEETTIKFGLIQYDFDSKLYWIHTDNQAGTQCNYFNFTSFKKVKEFATEKANEFIEKGLKNV
jgi:hypothetical protein